jgi:hypothetical protein
MPLEFTQKNKLIIMKNIFLKSILILTIFSGIFSSCINSDDYSTPENTLTTSELTTTTTPEAVNALATIAAGTQTPIFQYTADDIIEGYVTSSDEAGTFFKSISFQTLPVGGAAPTGFSVPINVSTLYGRGFTPGRKVFIKLKGLYIGKVFGSLQIGSLYEGTIGRISEFEWKNHLFPSVIKVAESQLVRTLTIADAYTDANQNTLIELDLVQFADGSFNRTYYDVDSGGGATNHLLTSTNGGTQNIIRFSSFAPFTGKQVPTGSGKIRGVLSKFNTDFQFVVRYESDIKLVNPRADVNPPIVGNNLLYLGNFTENFESYTAGSATTGQNNFPKYVNDPVIGSKTWRARTASNNKYIEMSSFGSPSEKNRTLFIVPVNMTAASTLSFQSRSGFYNGETLKVYYSTNYVPGGLISAASLVNITSNFAISTASSATATFTNSGIYTIPATVTGNGFFIFEYTGSGISTPALTTNMQIDNITVN